MREPLPDLSAARAARRLVLRLAQLPRLGPDDTPLPEFTQAGLAASLGITQGAVAKIVARLVAAGALEESHRRVSGSFRRRTVYTLNGMGEMLAHELEAKMGSRRTGPGAETTSAHRPYSAIP
ncbi:MAG: MarR family transcriptional regulator [Thermoplasmata archaeon]|nr:MarR family transcriptional regulator [Thermoplasmata archaeon]